MRQYSSAPDRTKDLHVMCCDVNLSWTYLLNCHWSRKYLLFIGTGVTIAPDSVTTAVMPSLTRGQKGGCLKEADQSASQPTETKSKRDLVHAVIPILSLLFSMRANYSFGNISKVHHYFPQKSIRRAGEWEKEDEIPTSTHTHRDLTRTKLQDCQMVFDAGDTFDVVSEKRSGAKLSDANTYIFQSYKSCSTVPRDQDSF